MITKTIAVLGLGAMGSRITQRLLEAHYPVVVYNRTPNKAQSLVNQGATLAITPRAAAEQADVVPSLVTDCAASEQIWLNPETGAVQGLQPGAIAIESSTLTIDWTQHLAQAIAARGAHFLDAPVVGSRPQAEAGQLIYLVGGDENLLTQVKDILLSAGKAVHHVGPISQGIAMKLAVNTLFSLQVAGLAELLEMLKQSGLSPENAMACLGELPITSPAMQGAGTLMTLNKHQSLFPIQLVEKDLRYGIQAAGKDAAPISSAVLALYQEAIAQGYGDSNITGITQLFGASK